MTEPAATPSQLPAHAMPHGFIVSTTKDGAPNIQEVAAALAKAQAAFQPVPCTEHVDTGKYRFDYASLTNILAMIRRPFAENGLLITFSSENGRGLASVAATIIHGPSGQFLQTVMSGPYKNDVKDLGATISYLRRYAAQSILGIAPGDESIAAEYSEPAPFNRDYPQDKEDRKARVGSRSRPEPKPALEPKQESPEEIGERRRAWMDRHLAKAELGPDSFGQFLTEQEFPTLPGAWRPDQMEFFRDLVKGMGVSGFGFAEVSIWLGGTMRLGKMKPKDLADVRARIVHEQWPSAVLQVNRQALSAR